MGARILSGLALLLWANFLGQAQAAEPSAESARSTAPCGVVQTFQGDVQVLDANRTEILETRPKSGVPCGGWVSVRGGQIEIRHRQGFEVRSAHDTFFELYDNQADERMTGEHQVVLFRGKILIQKPMGTDVVRVLTPNGRVVVEAGTAVVIYNAQEEETQLISLEHSAVLENRFEQGSQVVANAGESTLLNYKLLRLAPSVARPVDVGSLKLSLLDLPLSAPEMKAALVRANERQMPVIDLSKTKSRALAAQTHGIKSEYKKHKKTKFDKKLKDQWTRKLAGGAAQAEALLHPDTTHISARKQSRVWVEDVDPQPHPLTQMTSYQEKKRVLEELSKIHAKE